MNTPQPLNPLCTNALNVLCEDINLWATSKGWNEGEDSVQRKSSDIALMHSELSECLEFIRKKPIHTCPTCQTETIKHSPLYGGSSIEHWVCEKCLGRFTTPDNAAAMDDHVPALTGEAAELADVLIRIFHYCGRRGINLGEAVRLKHEYNLSRPYKHGKHI